MSDLQAAVASLTPRERQVLALLAKGMTNREIASQIGVSEQWIKLLVSRILTKLEVPNRAAAAHLYILYIRSQR